MTTYHSLFICYFGLFVIIIIIIMSSSSSA